MPAILSSDEKKESHIDMLRNIAQHMNMGGCILSTMDQQLMSKPTFDSTTITGRVYALIVALRDAAQSDVGASVLLQKVGQLFVEGVHDQEENMPRGQQPKKNFLGTECPKRYVSSSAVHVLQLSIHICILCIYIYIYIFGLLQISQ